MKSTISIILYFLIVFSSLEAGWRQKRPCRSGCSMPVGWYQGGCDQEPRYCYQPYVKYVCETCKIPECTYIPEEKWNRGVKYVPRYYEQKFIKYEPKVYTQKILQYEPVDTYSRYYTYQKCVKYNRHVNWVPKQCYRRCKYYPPDCSQCSECPPQGCIECK